MEDCNKLYYDADGIKCNVCKLIVDRKTGC
jgi:hypothetical protein